MTIKFIHPTVAQVLRVAAIIIAAANTILTVGATLTGVPEWLKWLTPAWPGIYGVALVLHQLASTCGLSPDGTAQSALAATLAEAKQVLAAFDAAKAGAPKA